ncbi:conserved hypothetical protein [Halorhabdus utahensis DSM 12940]|uniref:Uncharacterized protein n=1 Tax=Halorhabdus utahensis (strain DSM 12940 / JCM 11049 / AX-2) TaxID=519442 RepID=C7NQV5_HALUD|nr:hypothetical protein [Halorhabdus utahensis]ACV11859.1 conserved hypothetical protein [Halorhabdus utahensis DSM 12940]
MTRTRTDASGRDRTVDLRPALGILALIATLGGSGRQAGVRRMGLLDGLGDIIVGALQELLRILFSPIEAAIQSHGDALLEVVVQTPHPDAVFAAPTNGPWPAVHGYYWETIVPLSLSLWGLAIGVVILLESTSHLFSNYHRSKLKKRAFSGLIGILSWWWLAAFSLRFMDALAKFLLPSLEEIALFETMSFAAIGVIGLVISLTVDLALFVIIGLIYLIRQLVLYLFVLLMPILIVLWIPGVGPFTLVSRFMKKLAGFYVPFLFMSVPVALLFRVGGLLGQSAGLSAGGIGTWLTALVVPFAAVLSPFVLFWQAGAIMFMADRAARHVSAQRARRRTTTGKEQVQRAGHAGRNFARGVRDKPAVRSDGQTVFGSGDSTANAAGRRVNRTGSRLGDRFRRGGDDGGGGGSGGSDRQGNGGSDRRSNGGTRESRTDESAGRSDAGSGGSDAGRSTTTDSDRSDRSDRSGDRSSRSSDDGGRSDSSDETSRDADSGRTETSRDNLRDSDTTSESNDDASDDSSSAGEGNE